MLTPEFSKKTQNDSSYLRHFLKNCFNVELAPNPTETHNFYTVFSTQKLHPIRASAATFNTLVNASSFPRQKEGFSKSRKT